MKFTSFVVTTMSMSLVLVESAVALKDLPVSSGSIRSATRLNYSDNVSSVLGEVGLDFGVNQQLKFFGKRSINDASSVTDSYGFAYRLGILDNHVVTFKNINIESDVRESRSNYGVGYLYKLPTESVGSSVRLGYRSNEDVNTLVELRYSVAKTLRRGSALPVRLSALTRWRQSEGVEGEIVEGIGGAVGVQLKFNSKVAVDARYTGRDKISNEIGMVAATYTTRINGSRVSVKLGADSNSTAFLVLTTGG